MIPTVCSHGCTHLYTFKLHHMPTNIIVIHGRAAGSGTAGTAMAAPQFRPDIVIFQYKDIYHILKLLNSEETQPQAFFNLHKIDWH